MTTFEADRAWLTWLRRTTVRSGSGAGCRERPENEEQMYEGSIPLEDFLDTLNRLQADFERRLGGIERKVLSAPPTHPRAQERSGSSAWTPEDGYRPLGLEAIWTSPSTSSDDRSSGRRRPVRSHHADAFID
ncbi:hypothetical protein ACIA71_35220 [Streptomyces anulatus]|uniref:hypothetical protein n=2 Tax=Streptomyces anulatus TaxID=1892 RepID=UPI0037B3207F|nr:hypothetical protein OG536_28870 [Streptomyces anulatus]